MTRKQTDTPSHREIEELLPWYVNGTLPPHEREALAAHLAACPGCTAEAAVLRSVGSAVRESNESLPFPADARPDALLSRIGREAAPPLRERFARLGRWWARLPVSARWALAAQAVAVAALVCTSALLLRRASLSEDAALRERQRAEALRPRTGAAYEALSGRPEEAGGESVKLTVVFREDATLKEVRELLRAVGASVVSGPSSVGAYEIRVPVPDGSDARQVSRAAVERLRGRRDLVELAEPLPLP